MGTILIIILVVGFIANVYYSAKLEIELQKKDRELDYKDAEINELNGRLKVRDDIITEFHTRKVDEKV